MYCLIIRNHEQALLYDLLSNINLFYQEANVKVLQAFTVIRNRFSVFLKAFDIHAYSLSCHFNSFFNGFSLGETAWQCRNRYAESPFIFRCKQHPVRALFHIKKYITYSSFNSTIQSIKANSFNLFTCNGTSSGFGALSGLKKMASMPKFSAP